MAQLTYKTRGNSSPQGKQRVYFCCHPADFSAFLEPITEEILARQNCAVWYADPATPRDEAFLDDLKEMQLFVMPVTSRLLHSDNYALTVEFPFAIAHHIPVLPLMQEAGLDSVFNEKCGDLQFLDKHQTDPTALPYEEKLDKYLSGVLVGDELAERVRAAFDAYVFLSYRKKDRQHARELMRLIHAHPFCRDIAIWYDEFLTPGENFNDAIRAALEKSGLFVLTVTPNLVNEPNYVQQIEYPMAVEREKPVLPAEMVSTDADALADRYPGLPPCADAHDGPALSAALLAAVQRLAIEENDRSPQHNFFIGLAYLGGIDVEVDHNRAVALITGAAEAGLAEAAQKLVEMYRGGVGVERDYEEAIRWQEKLVELAEAAYAETPSEETLSTLFWHILRCGDYYKESGWLVNAKTVCIRALSCLHNSPYAGETARMCQNLSACYNRLGDICYVEGDLIGARQYYDRFLTASEKLTEEANTPQTRRALLVSYHRLGDICETEGALAEAKRYYEQFSALCLALAEETDTSESRRDLSISYNDLGDICRAEGDLTTARRYFNQGLAICVKLAEETGTPESMRDLSAGHQRLGDICRAEGNLTGAKPHYEQALTISIRLAEETGTLESRRNLSASYHRLGDICKLEGDYAGAKPYYEQALAISVKLAEECGAPEYRDVLAVSCYKLALLSSGEQKALLLQQALSIYEDLCQKCPDVARYKQNYKAVVRKLR